MSKSVSSISILSAVLIISVLATAGIFITYVYSLRSLYRVELDAANLQAQIVVANRDRALVAAMFNDAVDYARHSQPMAALVQHHTQLMRPAGQVNTPIATNNPPSR